MSLQTGKWMMVIGGCLFLAGLLVYLFHDKLKWLGHLPGDIIVKRENFRFYFPIVTTILFGLLITLIINIIRKLL